MSPVFTLHRWLAAALLTGGLLIPVFGHAEARWAPPGGSASASINIRIIVPPVLQVLENAPASVLQADGAGAWLGQQRLVVVSNLKRGFCAHLRGDAGQDAAGWTLQAQPSAGVLTERVADGWRVCTLRAGRHQLDLEHRFQTRGNAPAWPVATDITAL